MVARWKHGDYKVDSTRGSSRVEPRKYKRDALVQVWLDARVLSTLDKWLVGHDFNVRFLSEVVKLSLDQVISTIEASEGIKLDDFCDEARDYLDKRFGVSLNPKGKGEKNVMHNMVLDDRRRSNYNKPGETMFDPVDRRRMEIMLDVNEKMPEIERIYKELEARDNNRLNGLDENGESIGLKRLKECVQFDENGVSIRSDSGWADAKPPSPPSPNCDKDIDELIKPPVDRKEPGKVKMAKHLADAPRAMTQEELAEKARKLTERDRLEREAFDSGTPKGIKVEGLD